MSSLLRVLGAAMLGSLALMPLLARALSLDEALQLAVKHSPALAIAQAQAEGARAFVTTANAIPNPELELGSGVTRSRQDGGRDGRNEIVAISQPIEMPYLRSARQNMAAAGAEAGDASLQIAQLELRAAIKQAFYEVQRRMDEVELARDNFNLLQQIRNRVKVKVDVGEAARYELVKSEAETLAAGNALRSAELNVKQARDYLRTLIGAPLEESYELVPAALLSADLPELEAIRADLLNNHPRLKQAQAELRKADAGVDMEKAARMQQLTLKLSSERDPDMRQWRVGIAIPLPLWEQRTGPIRAALANQQRVEAEQKQNHLGLLAELDFAYARYQIARRQVETFESGLLKEAESAMKVAEAAYRFGERGMIDYLDAQRVWRSTRGDFLRARYELQYAMIVIEKLRALPVAGES